MLGCNHPNSALTHRPLWTQCVRIELEGEALLAFLTRADRRPREKSGMCAKGRAPWNPHSACLKGHAIRIKKGPHRGPVGCWRFVDRSTGSEEIHGNFGVFTSFITDDELLPVDTRIEKH